MGNYFNVLFDLLRLRAGPQDLPDHRGLTLVVIGAFIAVSVITNQTLAGMEEHIRAPLPEPASTLLSIALHFGAVAILLAWRRHPERIQQTFLAFASTDLVLRMLVFFLRLQNDPNESAEPFLALIFFTLFGWSLAVSANIFRHALNISMPIAMLVTVMLLAITYLLVELLLR